MVICKFEATALNWFMFLNQFETEIDQQDRISPVTMYSYPKDFLSLHVRKLVDSLPFTSEAYSRNKALTQAKFGKKTVAANTHINFIILLPIFLGSHPNLYDFYEKLMSSVQALETLRKLNEIKGSVRNALDKLPGIRAYLVRLDDSWQDWRFCELIEALIKWTVRNRKTIASEKKPRNSIIFTIQKRENKTCATVSIARRRGIS